MDYKKIKYFFTVIILILLMTIVACDNEQVELNNLQGVVSIKDTGIAGVEVSILDYDIPPQITDENGTYQFNNLATGTYTLQFSNEQPFIEEIIVVVVSGGKTSTQNLCLDITQTLQNSKDFIDNLKLHGINLTNVGTNQAIKIEENIENDLIPAMVEIGTRLLVLEDIFTVWNLLLAEGPPGDYTVEIIYEEIVDGFVYLDIEIIESDPITEFEDLETWSWNINIAGSDDLVSIELTNLMDIIVEEEIESDQYEYYYHNYIDFYKGLFQYTHIKEEDPSFNWAFEFSLESDSTEIIEIIEEDYLGERRWETYITVPRMGIISANGILEDNLSFELETYNQNNDINTITFNAEIILDLDMENYIHYTGDFAAGNFSYSGETNLYFSSFPSYKSIINLEEFPMLEHFNSTGTFSTQVFSISGFTEVNFMEKEIIMADNENILVPLPYLIKLAGSYEDITQDKGLLFEGLLEINMDFANYNIDLREKTLESKDNYLAVLISLDGSLVNMDYLNADDVFLNTTITKEYDKINSDFRYDYATDKYIVGNLKLQEEDFAITAYNEQYLKINIATYQTENKIGEISNYDGTEKYADIIMESGVPKVIFVDNSSTSLLP